MGKGKSSGLGGDERLGVLLDTLNQGVQENDCEGVILYSNRAHHRILGYEFGDLPGRRIWDEQPTEAERDSLRDYFESLKKEQPAPVPFLTRNRRKDGALVDLQVDWNYVRDADGTLRGFISVITDITERRKAEGALLRRSRGLAALLEVSRSFAATLDLQKILQASVDGVSLLVGLDTAAIYLIEDERLHLWATTPPLPPQFPDELRIAHVADHPHIGRAVQSGEPLRLPDIKEADLTPAERSVQEQRNLRTLLYLPLVAGVEVMGALIVGSRGEPVPIPEEKIDLSRTLANLSALAVKNARLYEAGRKHSAELEQSLAERRRAEEEREKMQAQLTQAQKLESIGQLAGGLAHDFNNMLGVILGHAELGLLGVRPSDSVYDDLREIQKAAERSADLTGQLLAFARKQTIAPRALDLNAAVDNMYKMLRRLISERIDLDWRPAADLWPGVMDPVPIDQILVNLCVNARDSIEGAGRILVETSNAELDQASCADRPGYVPGEYAVLAVSDTGCGMDRETREKVFEPFFTTKTMGQGTGMGLATVYGIVRQNGGFISVDSEIGGLIDVYSESGRGTTFRVYLPRNRGRADDGLDVGREDEIRGGSETVLIVEDEPALLSLGARMLEMLGYKVIAATSPVEAIRLAGRGNETIHLLMTDVVMPGTNGRELAEKIRSLHPDIKCLFVSGYTSNVIGHQGVLDEGVHFIQKPFSMRDLSEVLQQVLEHDEDGGG